MAGVSAVFSGWVDDLGAKARNALRRIRYNCAMSLDGYIAGPDDEFDWIVVDPDIDFEELFRQVDTYLLGRRTFEVTGGHSAPRNRAPELSCSHGR